MAFPVRLDVPQALPNALPELPDELGPALPVVQGRRFAGQRAAHWLDDLRRRDGSPEALFVTEVCRGAVVALTARLVRQVKLLPAGRASVRQEQQSAQTHQDEQHLLAAQSQDGAAVSVQALLPVPEASLRQAALKKLRAAQGALQAAHQQGASRLALPLQRQRLSVFPLRPALPRLPARGNAFLLFQPVRAPANSSASSFR